MQFYSLATFGFDFSQLHRLYALKWLKNNLIASFQRHWNICYRQIRVLESCLEALSLILTSHKESTILGKPKINIFEIVHSMDTWIVSITSNHWHPVELSGSSLSTSSSKYLMYRTVFACKFPTNSVSFLNYSQHKNVRMMARGSNFHDDCQLPSKHRWDRFR